MIGIFLIISSLITIVEHNKVSASVIRNESGNTQESCNSVCTTSICNKAASFYLSIMNQEVDPCDNFYQFVCGNFLNQTIIPESKLEVNTLSIVKDRLYNDIRNEIESNIKFDDLDAYKKMKVYYRNCMNESQIEEAGTKPFLEMIDQLGGWPILLGENWESNNYSWEDILNKMIKFGLNTVFPFKVLVTINSKDPTRYSLHLSPAATNVSDSFFLENNKSLNAYIDLMVNTSIELGANKDAVLEQIKECIDFEINLYKIKTPDDEMQSNLTNSAQMTISELSQKYAGIPWLKIFNQIFNTVNVFIDNTDTVEVKDLRYFSKLKNVLENTPKRALANYHIWQLLIRMLPVMPKKFQESQLIFLKASLGLTYKPDRKSRCINEIVKFFGIAASSMYLKKYFDHHITYDVTRMTNNIKIEFGNNLRTIDWMDEETRQHALKKLDAMAVYIGYSKYLLNNRVIYEYYKNLDVSAGDYMDTFVKISTFFRNQVYKILRRPVVNKPGLLKNIAVVNAYYILTKNYLEVPAGILQDPIYALDRPEYLNYGAIGHIIGHEMTHAFDLLGRKFDENGNSKNWWNDKAAEEFLNRTNCLVNKYNSYSDSEIKSINGNRTLNENIADLGGIKWAYQAYNKWATQNNIKESCLPGLNYTPRQMFWISAASTWCSKTKDGAIKIIIDQFKHSPSSARIIIPFSNSKEFANDFNCKFGTTMNPLKKCDLW